MTVETNYFMTRLNRKDIRARGISESAGASDGNKLVSTREDGLIDGSFFDPDDLGMNAQTYDPTGVEADVFDLSNHTGNITDDSVLLDGGLL